jgi:hypothetical protein
MMANKSDTDYLQKRKSQMKITKSKLKQIITEELQNILAEEDNLISTGGTRYMEPGEREAARKARAGAETKAIEWKRQAAADRRAQAAADRRARQQHHQRALKLLNILYPDASNPELLLTIRQEDDEGTLAHNLFGFLFPRHTGAKPNPFLMDRVEEWIATFDNPADAYFESRQGGLNEENLESFHSFHDQRVALELGREMFAMATADAESRGPARNVPVGKAATPGTPQHVDFDALRKAEVPPD